MTTTNKTVDDCFALLGATQHCVAKVSCRSYIGFTAFIVFGPLQLVTVFWSEERLSRSVIFLSRPVVTEFGQLPTEFQLIFKVYSFNNSLIVLIRFRTLPPEFQGFFTFSDSGT